VNLLLSILVKALQKNRKYGLVDIKKVKTIAEKSLTILKKGCMNEFTIKE